MPTHISTLGPNPKIDACKTRITEIGRRRGASVIDWHVPSAITREDSNFWDRLHYRVAIASRIAHDLAAAALQGKESNDGTYVLLVHND
jgi:hypothetical protein